MTVRAGRFTGDKAAPNGGIGAMGAMGAELAHAYGRTQEEQLELLYQRTADGQAMVNVRGELDIATRRPVFDTLVAMVADGVTDLVIDAAGLTFLDSSGLGLLLEVRRMGVSLTLRNPSPWVRRVLDLVMIDGLIGIEDV